MDDPDARMESAEPARGPLQQARARPKPSNPRAPYHDSLDPDHVDELLLLIGQGLALIEARERASPEATIKALAAFVQRVRDGKRRMSRDPADSALALGCLFGHQVCRELAWGWGHLRRARAPGIVLISPGFRHVSGPRHQIELALERGGDVLLEYQARLRSVTKERSGRDLYVRVR